MNVLSKLAIITALFGILSISGNAFGNPMSAPAASPTSPKTKAESKTVSKPESKDPKVASAKGASLTPAQESKLLALLNEGSEEELIAINGIAGTRAESIVSSRPFSSVYELILIRGVGEATYERIIQHGKTLTQPVSRSRKS